MDSQILESVLREILEEQKGAKQVIKKLTFRMEDLGVKIDGFNEKLRQQKVIAPPADTRTQMIVIHK